ncbi:hypothetical protein JTE90_000533 [Oedothorax gibbosus]|uniref:Monocarboxylate transporter n=1 Tax=Oedothorax gibbosus TaxID=931172 RepID=A0AAV6VWL2_9ARAC|nr:hypothetical protein JTE90_000533 [Oedothorax gibbosus]
MKTRNIFRKTIIVISSSLVYFIIYGALRLNAQLFLAVRERFGVDREQGSLPFVLVYTLSNVSGPFQGFLGKKIGLRCATALGCFLSAVSIAACFLVEDIIQFTISWGIGFGLGYGLAHMLIPNILQLYFTKTFNLMQGIFHAAGGIGCFMLPAFAEYILETYGTSGAFLIISGLVLNSVPVAMLLRCPERTRKNKSHAEVKETSEIYSISRDIKTTGTESVLQSVSEEVDFTELCRCQNIKKDVEVDISRLSNNGGLCQRCSRGKILSLNETLENSISYTDVINACNFENDYTGQRDYQFGSTDTILSNRKEVEKGKYAPFERKKYSAEYENEKNSVFIGSNPYSMEGLDYTDSKFNKYQVTKPTRESDLISLLNLQVFFDIPYILMLISFALVMTPVNLLTTVMVDACRDKGVKEDVTLLMTFASADVVGRLVFGYVADLRCTSPLIICALNSVFFGLLLIGFTWVNEFYSILVVFAFLGFLMGGIVLMPAGIIRDYIENENLTMAYSSRYFLVGLLNLSQPSFIGYFRESLHSYDGLFYSLGSMTIFGAIVVLFVPMVYRSKIKKQAERNGVKIGPKQLDDPKCQQTKFIRDKEVA